MTNLGPKLSDTHEGTLDHILALGPRGQAVEFGVGKGHSLRRIAAIMPVTGFDSFDGLPEDWREGFPAGRFACTPPDVDSARLVVGLYADTLPGFDFRALGSVGLWHIDCDLYSSTVTVLDHIGPWLKRGQYIVFDEFHGYEGHEAHESKAWAEYVERSGVKYSVIGHGPEQLAIKITKAPT